MTDPTSDRLGTCSNEHWYHSAGRHKEWTDGTCVNWTPLPDDQDALDAAEATIAEQNAKLIEFRQRAERAEERFIHERSRAAAAEATIAELTRERDENLSMFEEQYDMVSEYRDKMIAANQRITELEGALRRAKEDMEGWGAYASEYFREKWGLTDDLAAIDAALSTPTEEEQ